MVRNLIKIGLFLLSLLVALHSFAQNELPSTCGGDITRYGVTGSPGSVFFWTVEGGTIVNNYNDSIDVQWDYSSGVRIIEVMETNTWGCDGEPVYAQVFVSSPNIDLGPDLEICAGDYAEFYAYSADFTSYLWQDGSTDDTYIASVEGNYWVEVTDTAGCTAADTAYLTVHDLPVVDLGNDTMLCGEGAYIVLDAGNSGSDFFWSTGEMTQTIEVNEVFEDTEYWVEVTDPNGCIGMDTILIETCNDKLFIPTAFTPNGDEYNQYWVIEQLYLFPNAQIDIYNRWSKRVFHVTNPNSTQVWDGRDSNGKELPMDSYYYVIDLGDGSKPITGTVTIIR